MLDGRAQQIDRDLIRRQVERRLQLGFGADGGAMLDGARKDRPDRRPRDERQPLACFGIGCGRVRRLVGLVGQRRAVFDLDRFLRRQEIALFGLLRVGRVRDRVQIVEFFANFRQPQRRRK